MGKNITITRYQTARLDEWIGDYKSADQIYDEIQNSNDRLSYILENSIKKRKEKLPVSKLDYHQKDNAGRSILFATITMVDASKEALYRPESLQPQKALDDLSQCDTNKWKYSISVISKADDELRLDVRGYNPEGKKPKLDAKLPSKLKSWAVNEYLQFSGTDAILLEVEAYFEEESSMMYLSIDQWGLLYGSVFVSEMNLGDTLIRVHTFLCSLSNLIW